MNESNKKRIGVYFDKETIELCDAGLALTQARSRSEFISDAVEFYTTVLMKDHTTKVLTPVLESVIRASILNTENRLSRIIYKQAVATALMMHVMADVYDMNAPRLEELRQISRDEIKKLNGSFKFENVLDYDD
jgi:metal-responsive CopG/Arc/MetJ family transcriptional regulator